MKQLRVTDGVNINDNAVHYIASLKRLEDLEISNMIYVTDKGASQIASLVNLRRLKFHALISSNGIKSWKALKRLEHIDLSLTEIDEPSLETITRFKKLRYLDLSATYIDGSSFSSLLQLNSLEVLLLDLNHLNGLETVDTFRRMPCLNRLDVRGCIFPKKLEEELIAFGEQSSIDVDMVDVSFE